jgi:cobalt/nickel transport system permease protein
LSGTHGHALHYHGHSPVHRAAPQVKLVVLLLYVVSVVATPPDRVWAFSAHTLILLAVLAASGVPPRFFLVRLSIDLPFLLVALFLPLVGGDPRVPVGPLRLSEPGLWGAWNVLAKATLGAGASVLLVTTTETPAILAGLERLRFPRVVTAIAAFMVRYLEVVANEVRRTRIAMSARGYRPGWWGQLKPLAASAGSLFVRSFERGERVHQAMLARGFTGSMPVLADEVPASWWPELLPGLAAFALALTSRVLS